MAPPWGGYARSCNELNTCLNLQKTHGHQTGQVADLQWESPILKAHDPLIMLPTWGYVIIWKFFISTTTIVMGRIRLDGNVLKTSWRRLSPSSSEDVFRRRLQDVLIKTNIFILVMHLQDNFKTSSRHLAKTSSRRLQDVFKTSCKTLFKTSSRRL